MLIHSSFVRLSCLFILNICAANALHFASLSKEGKSILFVHDCGSGIKEVCKGDDMFLPGDDVQVERYLDSQHFDEVWLWSGGGDLDTGIKMANVFRRLRVTVRVPGNAMCASSCTVAFLGGWFRYVDPEAEYDVHSASRFLKTEALLPDWHRLKEDAIGELQRQARDERMGERDLAMRLFIVFQEAITPAHPDLSARTSTPEWLRQPTQVPYITSRQLQEDAEVINREGISAAQTVLMKLERQSMDLAISDLESILPSLGTRAKYALAMLRTMYSSRITSANQLDAETLLEMGYTTKVVNLGAK